MEGEGGGGGVEEEEGGGAGKKGGGGGGLQRFIKVVHVCITGTLLQTGFMIQGRACWR